MNWLILSCLLLLSVHSARSQNLVANPSFECGENLCDPTQDPASFWKYACGWNCPNRGTSDVFSTQIGNKGCFCSMPYQGLDAPPVHIGSQSPRTGDRFAGISTYNGEGMTPNYREYIQVKLHEPLTIGKYYCAEMYVSPAEFVQYSSGRLGMFFSETEVSEMTTFETLHFSPQVVLGEPIKDTVNWVKIYGAFQATTNANYLVIGNFNDDADTPVFELNGRKLDDEFYSCAYYFIDDVSVVEIDEPSVQISNHTPICSGQPARLEVIGNFDQVEWAEEANPTQVLGSQQQLVVRPEATTTYRVSATFCNYRVVKTITVEVMPFNRPVLGTDTTICAGTILELDPGDYASYKWGNGSIERYFYVNSAGRYRVSVTAANGCRDSSIVDVRTRTGPKVSIGGDTLICRSPIELIAVDHESDSFLWSTGSKDAVISVSQGGDYWVTVANQCGLASDTIAIESHRDVYIPNVVTLNGDELNGRFQVVGLNEHLGILKIFDRNGNSVFFDPQYNNDWPSKDSNLPTGVYYFSLEYPGCVKYKGPLHILK